MPIYEFYCEPCHTIFEFLSRRIDTRTSPGCPKCSRPLSREVSVFAHPRHADGAGGDSEDGPGGDLPIDDARLEQAMESMAGDMDGMNDDDPRHAAQLMRKFSDLTGMRFKGSIEEAIARMAAGEDPEAIEAELGDALEDEDPFEMGEGVAGKAAGSASRRRRRAPRRDTTLYDMPTR